LKAQKEDDDEKMKNPFHVALTCCVFFFSHCQEMKTRNFPLFFRVWTLEHYCCL